MRTADPRLGRSHPQPERAARISQSAILGGPSGNAVTEAADHVMMRRLLTPAFSARRMHVLRAHIAELVGTLLDRLADRDGRPTFRARTISPYTSPCTCTTSYPGTSFIVEMRTPSLITG